MPVTPARKVWITGGWPRKWLLIWHMNRIVCWTRTSINYFIVWIWTLRFGPLGQKANLYLGLFCRHGVTQSAETEYWRWDLDAPTPCWMGCLAVYQTDKRRATRAQKGRTFLRRGKNSQCLCQCLLTGLAQRFLALLQYQGIDLNPVYAQVPPLGAKVGRGNKLMCIWHGTPYLLPHSPIPGTGADEKHMVWPNQQMRTFGIPDPLLFCYVIFWIHKASLFFFILHNLDQLIPSLLWDRVTMMLWHYNGDWFLVSSLLGSWVISAPGRESNTLGR